MSISLFCGACAPGVLYTDITVPLTTNMQNTPVGTREAGQSSTTHIRLPIPRYRVGAEWSSRAIGDAAKKAGLRKVYYADLQTYSLFFGTYRKEVLHVWGE